MSVFDHSSFAEHEGVHFFSDAQSGLKCIIAVHSTALGPAAGGCRMWAYPDSGAALRDVLRLSEGMSYKNAMAGLDLGGGKAVVIGDPRTMKSPALFRALGRAVESLGGHYYTAEDVGVSTDDMRHVREETRFVAGLTEGAAASGDPSPVTARGIYLGIRTCLRMVFGSEDPAGRTIAVQGIGHVGGHLAQMLAADNARLFITDINADALSSVAAATGAQIVAPDSIYDLPVDVFSPNALGAVVDENTLPRFRTRIIAGGANNQLATRDMGEKLAARGILYAPDYVINGGGIINVAAEIRGAYDPSWVEAKLRKLNASLAEILEEAGETGEATNLIADRLAKARIAARMRA